MQQALLILNSGSSSLKFSIYPVTKAQLISAPVIYGQIEALDEQPVFLAKDANKVILAKENLTIKLQHNVQAFSLDYLLNWLDENLHSFEIVAAGHRVVHGADKFYQPTIINNDILAILESFNPLAPLHQPYNIAGIRALIKRLPTILQVACFDTAFHSTQSAIAQAFALPEKLSSYPIKRYGFHGLSYKYIAQVLPEYLGEQAEKKIIVAHLGHGASLCAMENRQSVATTMGFTALDGLPMGTRCGNLDPGVILYLVEQQKMSISAVSELLYNRSGLLGISEISADVRQLLNSNNPKAKFAIDLFVYRIVREMGSLVAALGGLNSIIFTGGIGEHAAAIRASICKQMAWLGIQLNEQANSQNKICISTIDSAISVWVIPTNEELVIAQNTWRYWQEKCKL
jgi:acetate kinase